MNHAQVRALERYGINLAPRDLRKIARDIFLGRGIMLKRQESGIETWIVKIREHAIQLVFNPKMCKIITIVPHGRRKPDRSNSGGRHRRKAARHR